MRDDFLTVIEWQPHVLRARCGVGEVIQHPQLEIVPRAALRLPRDVAVSPKAGDYLVGQALDEAERSGEELEFIWPLQLGLVAGNSSATNGRRVVNGASNGDSKGKSAARSEGVVDWIAAEALFRYVLHVGLGLPTKPVNHMFLLCVPPQLPPSSWESLTQVFFEHLFVSNFLIIERPLVQLYSCAAVTGVVVDVAAGYTDISVIYESQLHYPSMSRCEVGEEACDAFLASLLLQSNPELPAQLAPDGQPPLEGMAAFAAIQPIINILKAGEYIKFSFARDGGDGEAAGVAGGEDEEEEEGITDVAKAIASGKVAKLLSAGQGSDGISLDSETDTLSIPHPSGPHRPPILVGPERHRYALPLFDPSLLQGLPDSHPQVREADPLPLQDVVAAAVSRYPSPEARGSLWENIVFTGSLSSIRGVASALIANLQRHAAESSIASPTESGEKRKARHAKTPDYFSEYRERPDMTGFLGGCIFAKLGFSESQGGEWITKQGYNECGPRIATMLADGNGSLLR